MRARGVRSSCEIAATKLDLSASSERVLRDDRVTRAIEDRGERRPFVQEGPAQLGGPEREGQLSPNEPEITGVSWVQRATPRRPDREVACLLYTSPSPRD